MKKSKSIKDGDIYKLVKYVAICGTCDASYVSNEHHRQRGFVTELREKGWVLDIDNNIYCDKCKKLKKKEEGKE